MGVQQHHLAINLRWAKIALHLSPYTGKVMQVANLPAVALQSLEERKVVAAANDLAQLGYKNPARPTLDLLIGSQNTYTI